MSESCYRLEGSELSVQDTLWAAVKELSSMVAVGVWLLATS